MLEVTRHQWISEAAYFKSEARNFEPGGELDDWLVAENDYASLQIERYLTIAEEDGGLTITGLQQLAKSVGVENPENINLKIELIQAIQEATHRDPCFRVGPFQNCHDLVEACKWKHECRKLIVEWRR